MKPWVLFSEFIIDFILEYKIFNALFMIKI